MKILLDTQVWLWALSAPARLSRRARSLLLDDKNELWLSAATPWELSIKVAAGKLILPLAVDEYVATRRAQLPVQHLPITYLHGVESATLPSHHRDPFDRVLIAQARLERLAVMTADAAFGAYDVVVVRAGAKR